MPCVWARLGWNSQDGTRAWVAVGIGCGVKIQPGLSAAVPTWPLSMWRPLRTVGVSVPRGRTWELPVLLKLVLEQGRCCFCW